jgi:hypothetical protein
MARLLLWCQLHGLSPFTLAASYDGSHFPPPRGGVPHSTTSFPEAPDRFSLYAEKVRVKRYLMLALLQLKGPEQY